MSDYSPPTFDSPNFNTSLFLTDGGGYLTLLDADSRYLRLAGGTISGLTTFLAGANVNGTLSINGSPVDLSLISGVTAGTPQNSKALSLDHLGNINGALNCTQLNTNLTSSGLSWLSIAGTSTIALNHTLNGTALLGSTTNTAFGFLTNNTERARILNNGNFGIGTASAAYKLDVSGDINTSTLLRVNRSTSGQAFLSTNGSSILELYHTRNSDATFGTTTAHSLIFKTNNVARMTIASTGEISGISSLTGTTLIASSTLTVNGVDVGSNLAPLVGITLGTPQNSKALTLDASGNINAGISSLTGTTLIASSTLTVNGVDVGSNLAPLVGITLGTPANSKALTLDASGNINGGFNISSLIIGTNTNGPNLLKFYGTTDDTGGNNTVIAERIYGATEKSELILFKGNDPDSISGPDRIRLRAAEHRFQTYTSAENWTTLADNNDRFVILNNGNCGIGVSTPAYQLELASGGTGMNIPALKFDGTTFNQSYYLNITTGSGDALKAIVPNSDKDVSGLRNLSITGAFIASTSIASPSITCNTITGDNGAGSSILNLAYTTLNINGTSMTSTAAELNYVDVSVGVSTASKALVMNASNKIGSIGELGFSPLSLLYKTVLRADTSGGAGIEFYDTQFSTPTQRPLINFKTGNNAEPWFFRMCGYLSDNDGSGAYPANGCPFNINFINQVSWDSGLRLGCINQSQASNNGANIGLWARNFTIPHFIAQDRFNQAHIKPTSSQLNSQITGYGIVCGENVCMNGGGINAMRGNATVFSMINTTGSTSDRISFTMDHNTQWEMSLGGSAHSTVPNGLYWYNSGYKMVLTQSGRLGLGGATSPSCTLDVATENSVTTTTNIAIDTLSYNISSNSWSNLGGGPVSVNMCGRFRGSIWVQDKLYATSDRRLKTDITPLDFTLEHYTQLNPVSYKWKNDDKTMLGLVAQDVKNICAESVSAVENPNMKAEIDDDPEGYQLTVDYNCINMMNVVAIKKLIDKVQQLEDTIKEMQKKIV